MPSFSTDEIDIEPYEFISACRPSEIRDLIIELVEEEHLPQSVLGFINTDKNGRRKISILEEEFMEKMDKLSKKYHIISKEDEETIEKLFKKYI